MREERSYDSLLQLTHVKLVKTLDVWPWAWTVLELENSYGTAMKNGNVMSQTMVNRSDGGDLARGGTKRASFHTHFRGETFAHGGPAVDMAAEPRFSAEITQSQAARECLRGGD